MSTEVAMVVVAALGLAGSLAGSFLAHRKGLTETKAELKRIEDVVGLQIEQLDKKVEVHNHLIERMYNVESSLMNICYRVDLLEGKKKPESK